MVCSVWVLQFHLARRNGIKCSVVAEHPSSEPNVWSSQSLASSVLSLAAMCAACVGCSGRDSARQNVLWKELSTRCSSTGAQPSWTCLLGSWRPCGPRSWCRCHGALETLSTSSRRVILQGHHALECGGYSRQTCTGRLPIRCRYHGEACQGYTPPWPVFFFVFFLRKKPYMPTNLADHSNTSRQTKKISGIVG